MAHNSESFKLLREMIEARIHSADARDHLDRRIWSEFGTKSAIMFTDLAGFSRQILEFGILHFLQIIFESQKLFEPSIKEAGGQILKFESDSMLVVFEEVAQAMDCAVKLQEASFLYNQKCSDTEKILLCVGLGYGDCLRIGDVDVFGADVNAASKLGEDTAKAGEIWLTADFKNALPKAEDYSLEKTDVIPPGSRDFAYKLCMKS